MFSNLFMEIPYKTMLESGDCASSRRFSPDFFKEFNKESAPQENAEDKLHPINRFFAALDPEMWELSDSPSNSKKYVSAIFPTAFLTRLFECLSFKDLKVCRLVCNTWSQLVCKSLPWTTGMVAVISGDSPLYINSLIDCIGCTCASYLDSSKTRFRFWTHLRIRNLKSHNLYPLLTHHASTFARTVKNVRTLELIHCSITWTDLLELMYLLRGVETVHITFCNFSAFPNGIAFKCMTALGLVKCSKFENILQDISEICPPEDYFYAKLKTLCIHEDDDQDKMMTPLLLALLKDRTPQLDNFVLQLGQSTLQLREPEDQNSLWQSVHTFLAQKNVIKCRIESSNVISSGMVNRFFTYLSVWKFPPPDSEFQFWRMQELAIHFRPLIMWGSFERYLIPLVQKFPFLRVLSLKHIVLRGNRAYLVRGLMEKCPENCRLEVGLVLDDQGGLEAANLEKELLSSELYRKNLVTIDVVVKTDATRELRDMIPYKKNITFPTLHLFSVTTNGLSRPRFFTFNINVLVHNFPNLTELSLVDGPPLRAGSLFSSYLGADAVWKDMSGAVVCDDDMQLILRNLVKLKKLVIRANMKYLTDSGFTGFSVHYCKRLPTLSVLHSEMQRKLNAFEHRDGVSFENLPYLRHLSVEGVGASVTDVTMYLAFRRMKASTLKFLNLFGAHHISKTGKEYLRKEFPDCKIMVN